ncbi:hypothetical protein BDZ45DRAFT_755140 [Acephala macrosclerotiorum]|nr:hypothetical protein BDZ45DRAFT_755140 [Acephala macrosclerotiorum]
MGIQNDPSAAVDSRARVIGVKGLRVVDASAFPFMLPGHQAAAVFGLAERVADWIKEDWGQGRRVFGGQFWWRPTRNAVGGIAQSRALTPTLPQSQIPFLEAHCIYDLFQGLCTSKTYA